MFNSFKKISAATLLTATLASGAANSAEVFGPTAMVISSPGLSVTCAVEGSSSEFCRGAYQFGLSVSFTTFLLKEMEAAGPDALDYAAGSAPSPLLYEVAQKLQQFVAKESGEDITFDQAVDAIISNF